MSWLLHFIFVSFNCLCSASAPPAITIQTLSIPSAMFRKLETATTWSPIHSTSKLRQSACNPFPDTYASAPPIFAVPAAPQLFAESPPGARAAQLLPPRSTLCRPSPEWFPSPNPARPVAPYFPDVHAEYRAHDSRPDSSRCGTATC